MRKGFEKFLLFFLRITLGWMFLWAFLDKTWGLERNTPKGEAWIDGVSPTEGFLLHATQGSLFAEIFQSMSGLPWVDWLFMFSLASIGIALILGVMTRLAGVGGALLSLLIFLAVMPAETNPLITYHVVFIFAFLLLSVTPCGDWFGLGKKWSETRLVKGAPFLK